MENFSFALGIVGLLTGALVMWLALSVGRAIGDLRRRVADLEEGARTSAARRHTHRTIAGLEDAMALIIDMEIEADALMARLRTARQILGRTRQGPEAYKNKEWEKDEE